MPPISVIIKETRGEFLTASVIPVMLGAAVAFSETGRLDWWLLLLTFAGAACLHIGTNVANDYFDHLSENDLLNVKYVRPFTGGSRLIQEGLITPRAVFALSMAFFSAGIAIGVVLTVLRGPVILLFGAAGLISGYFYTGPPIRLAHHGLGEGIVGINFGLLIGIGTYYVQTGGVSTAAIVASLPLTLLVTSIIVINEFQDSEADARVGKRTLVVRLGLRRSVYLYAAISSAAYVPIIAGVVWGLFPPLVLISLTTVPLIIGSVMRARRFYDTPGGLAPANAATIACHALTGMLMAGGFLLGS
jgi:1,4-dihydroxy-2-naphthoate octaprenyltransferase